MYHVPYFDRCHNVLMTEGKKKVLLVSLIVFRTYIFVKMFTLDGRRSVSGNVRHSVLQPKIENFLLASSQ